MVLHLVFVALTVLFAGLTFALLQPLLDLLFKQEATAILPEDTHDLLDYLRAEIGRFAVKLQTHYSKESALLFVAGLLIGLNSLGNAFRFLAAHTMGTIRTGVVKDLRNKVFNHILWLRIPYIENKKKGDIISRLTTDVQEVETSVVITFEAIFREPLYIIFFLTLMIMQSWQLTLFIFIVLPVAAVVITTVTKSLKRNATKAQALLGDLMSLIDEAVSGIRVIRAFGAEQYTQKVFNADNQEHSRISRKIWHRKAIIPSFSEASGVVAVGLIIWYGGKLVYSGDMEASGFIAYVALFSQIIRPAKAFANSFTGIHKGLASADRIYDLLENGDIVPDTSIGTSVPTFVQALHLRNLSFEYIDGQPVLQNLNLKLERGKMYGLVGPSGSGKTTLAELLLRFYEPTRGAIVVDDVPLNIIKLHDWRKLTAVVTQEPILFNDTVRSNIIFGQQGVTDPQLVEAAKAANAHDFIMALSKGYDTPIGDRGSLLSGGQRQRLSIARALIKNPPILILDEATSALDATSERLVQDALFNLMQNRTTLVIAHRLSTIREADKIFVLEEGVITEEGTHNELLDKRGMYFQLYMVQNVEATAREAAQKMVK